jgi:hypothetical protein
MVAFLDACVHVALAAAERGIPLQRRSDIPKVARDEIERRAGFRPGLTEIRKALEEGVQAKLLRYLAGRSHVTAGYYRNDIDPDNAAHFGIEEAERLADQADLRDMLKQ